MKSLLYIGNKLSVHGYTQTTIETLGPLFESEGCKVYYASSKINKAVRFLDMLVKTFQFRSKISYVIIDTYSTSNFWYAFAVSQLCRILELQYIPILHGGNLPERLKKNPRICRMIFNNAYKNVSPSNYLMHHFKDASIKKLVYIPNSIEIENYPFKLRENIGPKLFWVRSFAKIYNPKMAVEVFNSIKRIFPDAKLCMVGPEKDGSLEEAKKYAKDLNVEVFFTGKMAKKDWIALSSDYDIFLNTTHFDNTPVSVMEAMALGLPVISTNVGGIPYLLQDEITGILVNDGDEKMMSEAIQNLISNTQLVKYISHNSRELAENFDWEKVKFLWEKILS